MGRTLVVSRDLRRVRSRHSKLWMGHTEESCSCQSGFDWSVKAIHVGRMRRWPASSPVSWILVIMNPRHLSIFLACHAR